MATLTITEAAYERAKRHAAQGGHASVEDYVEELIEGDTILDMPASFTTKAELEALILEALNDPRPSVPFLKADLENLKKELTLEFG